MALPLFQPLFQPGIAPGVAQQGLTLSLVCMVAVSSALAGGAALCVWEGVPNTSA